MMVAIARLPVASRNAMLDALTARIDAGDDAGSITFYDGPMPPTADASPSGQRLATLNLSRQSFHAASKGVAESYPVEDGSAAAGGKIAWARLADSAGNGVLDVNVGLANAVVILNTLDTFIGGPVTLMGITLRMSAE